MVLASVIVTVILVLAVLKPWAGTRPSASPHLPSSGPVGVAEPSPAARATPSAAPPGYGSPGGQCFPGSDWRVFTIETHAGRALRTWLSIEPGAAASPGDPGVPFVTVVADRLIALGFCARSGRDGHGSQVEARAWAVAAGMPAVPIALAPLVAQMPHRPDLGAVYRPPSSSASASGDTWSPGRYVFAVNQGPTTGDEHWFGVEVVAAPGKPAAPATPSAPFAP